MMNYEELVKTLNAIEAFFRQNKVHEHFIEAITTSKSIADRQLNPGALIQIDVSLEESKFNCPNCGFTYFSSKHPAGHDSSTIQLTENDNHCIKCGKRIMMAHSMCMETCNVTTSDYTM